MRCGVNHPEYRTSAMPRPPTVAAASLVARAGPIAPACSVARAGLKGDQANNRPVLIWLGTYFTFTESLANFSCF